LAVDKYTRFRDLDRIEKGTTARYILVVRKLLIHGHAESEGVCHCCGSHCAAIEEERDHIVVLFDRLTGDRKRRTEENAQRFDAYLVKLEADRLVKTIHHPARVHRAGLEAFLDRTTKIIGAFGGNRSGKSTWAYEKLVDEWLLEGTRGAKFIVLAPTRDMLFSISLEKLVKGEVTNRKAEPLFPPELVSYFPTSPQAPNQFILLIDGSKILLAYGSGKGGNIKGLSGRFAVVDEGTEIRHEINWTILVNRMMDSRGRVVVATTPVAGHWLRTHVYDKGTRYGQWVAPGAPSIRIIELSCLNNPWIPQISVEETIRDLGGPDDPRVKREIFGQWVTDGIMLWRHFDTNRHAFEGLRREADYYGFVDLTPKAVRSLFDEGSTEWLGGMDFNNYPMSLLLCKVVCKPEADQSDPRNWILWVRDEMVKKTTIADFPDYLRWEGPKVRRMEKNAFAGLCIVGDANASYPDTRVNQLGKGADADFLIRAGFYVKPPAWTNTGEPKNPSIRDRVNLLHELMFTNRLKVHGSDCPKLMESILSQEAMNTGLPVKDPGKESDRLSGPTDALGYLAYAIFGGPSLAPAGEAVW
jgi:hypothetical protein